MMCWFPTANVYVWVDLLWLPACADPFEMIALLGMLQLNFDDVANFNINKMAQL
jgi:hypothetical protein